MAELSIWHVFIFTIVVILLFATSQLKNLGKEMSGAVTDVKNSFAKKMAPQSRLANLTRWNIRINDYKQ